MTKTVEKTAEQKKPENGKSGAASELKMMRLTSVTKTRKHLAALINEFKLRPDREKDAAIKYYRAQGQLFRTMLEFFRTTEMEALAERLEEIEKALAKGEK